MTPTVTSFLNSFQTRIEEPVRIHLKNVYACVSLSIITAAIGAYVDMFTNLLSNGFLTLVAGIGLLCALHWTKDDSKNRKMRLGFLLGFSFCIGLGLGPLMEQVIGLNPAIIPQAFFLSAVVFVSFSISAMLARQGSWLYLGGTIASVLFTLSVYSLASLIYRSTLFFQIHLYIGLLLMCAFVLYDTQLIMEKRRRGDKDFIAHSVDLFIDFIGIFRRIMIILAQKEEKKENKKS